MKAYVLVDVRSGEERSVTRALKGQEGILKANFTFGPYDVICEIESADLSGLGKVVFQIIRATPGVLDTVTCLQVD